MSRPLDSCSLISRRAFGTRLLAITGSTAFLAGCPASRDSLTLACAAGWRTIVARAVTDFETEHNLAVRTLYDGSGRLSSTIRLRGGVDLFLSADVTYVDALREEPIFSDVVITPLRQQHVRCVRGTDAPDVSLNEMIEGDSRISLASPDTAAVSRVLRRTLGAETFDRLAARAHTRTTVTEVAADVAKLNAADYGFIWDTTWASSEDLVNVPMPELKEAVGTVAICRFPGQGSDEATVRELEATVAESVKNASLDDTSAARKSLDVQRKI